MLFPTGSTATNGKGAGRPLSITLTHCYLTLCYESKKFLGYSLRWRKTAARVGRTNRNGADAHLSSITLSARVCFRLPTI
jgi:hypothetical protein